MSFAKSRSSDTNGASSNIDDLDFDNLVAIDDKEEAESGGDHKGQHPTLSTMCIINCANKQRIIPNKLPPAVLDNDLFTGHVMMMVRTPDVDHPNDPNILAPTPQRISEYFRGKKRQFEFQFQIKLKKIPSGPLFLGCELDHPIKVGTITKGLCGILLAMVRRINPGFHYAWGDHHKSLDKKFASGDYEKTHLSFPVEASMDRIVITKPGETLPQLGHELHETNESVKRRRKMGAGSVDWNLEDTYTMCLWSAYVNWIKWKSINVPGVSPFLLSRVTGQQPIHLSVYEIAGVDGAEYRKSRPPHLRKNLKMYANFEFSNIEKTVGGLAESVVPAAARAAARSHLPISSEQSLPDTESVNSDNMETASRVTA